MRELPNLTLPQMLRENARTMPERIALRQKDFGIWLPISWADYDRRARHFGLGLRALGLAQGGHVGILSENRYEWLLVDQALPSQELHAVFPSPKLVPGKVRSFIECLKTQLEGEWWKRPP